jgi:hypothetical protein
MTLDLTDDKARALAKRTCGSARLRPLSVRTAADPLKAILPSSIRPRPEPTAAAETAPRASGEEGEGKDSRARI